MEKGKRASGGCHSWAEKKKLCKENPVKETKSFDFSQVKEHLKKWEIIFRCAGFLLKDSPSGGDYKILIVCCVDVVGNVFRLTSMGPKAFAFNSILENDGMYLLRNAVVVKKGNSEMKFSWMTENMYDLKSDCHTTLNVYNEQESSSFPNLKYCFLSLEQLTEAVNNKIVDTFGYLADEGRMKASISSESHAENLAVGITLGSTSDIRLMIKGMGYHRGDWWEKSGIKEDSIVSVKGIRLEGKIEGTQDWLALAFDDTVIRVNEGLDEAKAIAVMKEEGSNVSDGVIDPLNLKPHSPASEVHHDVQTVLTDNTVIKVNEGRHEAKDIAEMKKEGSNVSESVSDPLILKPHSPANEVHQHEETMLTKFMISKEGDSIIPGADELTTPQVKEIGPSTSVDE